jgi:DNA polymerase III subunit epsilon
MRQIILDTETTGLNARLGDRIIEIGCVELSSRRFTGNNLHLYINPERRSELAALEVHGISDEFLADKPKFAEIAREFIEYIRGAELIIHNAEFDVEFLDMELGRLGLPPVRQHCAGVIDTLKFARELHPGKKNSLDSLCERYEIDNSHRTTHGGLLDATLLAEVYLAMTRGQDSLAIDLEAPVQSVSVASASHERPKLVVIRATDEELAAHEAVLAAIDKASKGRCVWKRLETAEQALAA